MMRKKIVFVCILSGLIFICGCGKLHKADTRMGEENYNEAIELYKEHLAEHPDSLQVRTRLGYAYFRSGLNDEAIAEFKKVLESVPGEPDAVLYMGLAYLHKGDIDKGISVLENYQNKEYPKVEEEVLYQVYIMKDAENKQTLKSSEIADSIESAADKIMSSQKSEKRKQPWKKGCNCN